MQLNWGSSSSESMQAVANQAASQAATQSNAPTSSIADIQKTFAPFDLRMITEVAKTTLNVISSDQKTQIQNLAAALAFTLTKLSAVEVKLNIVESQLGQEQVKNQKLAMQVNRLEELTRELLSRIGKNELPTNSSSTISAASSAPTQTSNMVDINFSGEELEREVK